MAKQTTIKKLLHVVLKWPKKYIFLGFALIVVVALMTIWFLPRNLVFSYNQTSCINQFVVAPGAFKSSGQDGFRVVSDGNIEVAGVAIASTKACIKPITPPKPGEYKVNLAAFGWGIGAKTFTVSVAKPPVVSVKPLDRQLPVALPLKLPLTQPDEVFTYKLIVGDKKINCETTDSSLVSCDIKKLSLQQGATYVVALDRYFEDKKVATLTTKTVETLRATAVVSATIKPGEIIYSKPQGLQIKLDKAPVSAEVELVKIEGTNRQVIPTKLSIKDDTIDVSWTPELARSFGYEIVLKNVIAKDSSSLAAPYVLPFQTSGGPKVAGLNVGKIKVSLGAAVVVTFDQALLESQDIHKAITTTGGAAITGFRGNQVFINTANVAKCGEFTISVNNALISSHGISGGSAWRHSARMLCHTIGSIGTSVKGRAIQAYYFGSGPTSIIYVGAIHGDELSTRSLMLRWIDELEANAGAIPADKTIVVIPTINPDGAATGKRTNANNVDLNRNFNVSDWKTDVTTVTNAPFPGGGGSAPMSEPETRALAGLVARLRPRLVLSYHSVASVVAGNQAGDSVALAAAYAGMSGYRNVSGATASTFEYQVTGTSDDYFAEKLGIASILIELGSSSYHQFERNQKAMWDMAKR